MSEPASAAPTLPERRLATAELVLDIATAAAGETELDDILRAALDRLRHVVAYTGGSIALVDEDDLVIRAAVGPFEAEALGQRLPRGMGRSWRIVQTLERERIDDLRTTDLRITGDAARLSVRSWLGVPIPRRGRGIGLLEVDSTEPAAFDDADADLLETVARALAGPIDLAARYAAERRGRRLRDAFTGMVSHELRTPITTIFGMSQILRQRYDTLDDEARRHLIADVESEADRLRRLVDDLLILGRAEGGQIDLLHEPIVIGHVLRRAIADESRRWPEHRFSTAVADGLPIVLGEETYVEQIVRNLLSNAAKYSPPGSEIGLSAAPGEGFVEVRVTDTGIGIPDGPEGQLFDLYYRSAEATLAAPGAGIGLFVCRELLSAMGGRIWARRREEGGSEFGFTLPVEREHDERSGR